MSKHKFFDRFGRERKAHKIEEFFMADLERRNCNDDEIMNEQAKWEAWDRREMNAHMTSLLIRAIQAYDYEEILKFLGAVDLEAINGTVDGGWTALHVACDCDNAWALQGLLQVRGIDVNVQDIDGDTPIMIAAKSCRAEPLKLLKDDHRVDMEIRNNEGLRMVDVVGFYGIGAEGQSECLEIIEENERGLEEREQKSYDSDDLRHWEFFKTGVLEVKSNDGEQGGSKKSKKRRNRRNAEKKKSEELGSSLFFRESENGGQEKKSNEIENPKRGESEDLEKEKKSKENPKRVESKHVEKEKKSNEKENPKRGESKYVEKEKNSNEIENPKSGESKDLEKEKKSKENPKRVESKHVEKEKKSNEKENPKRGESKYVEKEKNSNEIENPKRGESEDLENKEISQDDPINDQDDRVLEDVRANVRIQYIEKIEKVNKKIEGTKQTLKRNTEVKKGEIKNLKKKQSLEKSSLEVKSDQEKKELDQKKAELQQQLAILQQRSTETQERRKIDSEKMNERHREEELTLEERFIDKESQKVLDNLIDIRDQLAKDLSKLDMDEDNSGSSNDNKNLSEARDILECPICMETMKPPTRIWMCPDSHSICESCKNLLEGKLCPTCRTKRVTLRAFMAENFARALFQDKRL